MHPRTINKIAILAGAILVLAGCSFPADHPAKSAVVAPTGAGPDAGEALPHGYVEGAVELSEPPLTLTTIDEAGEVTLLNLADQTRDVVAKIPDVTAISGDGRFVFASTSTTTSTSTSTTAGVTIVDTGAWTVDHEDHSHYYRAQPAIVGSVEGSEPGSAAGSAPRDGAIVVAGGGAVTAITFTAIGESVLLDTAALGTGKVVKVRRVAAGMAVPFGAATLIASGGSVAVLDQPDTRVACAAPSGTIATRVGVVIGCRDGAILATSTNEVVDFEAVPYPEEVAEGDRAMQFHGRPGRPTVAALAGTAGFWLLDTRERAWTRHATPAPLLRVSAADDTGGHVVALDAGGRILTLDGATGATLAATEPLLGATVADPALLAGVELTVDANRAYANAPAEGAVYEIDYADGARVARTFAAPTLPLFLAETGRLS